MQREREMGRVSEKQRISKWRKRGRDNEGREPQILEKVVQTHSLLLLGFCGLKKIVIVRKSVSQCCWTNAAKIAGDIVL